MVAGEYKSCPQTLHTTPSQIIMAWYGGDETILQISCGEVKSLWPLKTFYTLSTTTFHGPPSFNCVGDLAKATTMMWLNLLHMRSDSILFLEILPLSQELVDLVINNFPLALPTSVSLIIKVCEAK